MKWIKLALMLVTVLFLIFTIGCSEKSTGSEKDQSQNQSQTNDPQKESPQSSSPSPSQQTPVNNEPVELVFHGTKTSSTEEWFMENFGAFIKQKFPNVKMKYLPYTNEIGTKDLLALGETIDVIQAGGNATAQFVLANNFQLDITALIRKNNFDLAQIESTTIEFQKMIGNGAIYGLPYMNITNVLFYNKNVFDKFGVDYPSNNESWDEVYEMAKKLTRTDSDVNYRGMVTQFAALFQLSQRSVPLQNSQTFKALYSGDAFKKEIDFISSFYLIPGSNYDFNPMNLGQQATAFMEDRAAMFAAMDNTWINYKFDPAGNWDIAKLPYLKEMPDMGPQLTSEFWYITNTNKHQDLTFQIIASFTSEEYQLFNIKKGRLPVRTNSAGLLPHYAADVEGFANKNKDFLWTKLASPRVMTKYDNIGQAHQNWALGQIVLEGRDINTVLREATENHDKDIEAQLSQ